MFPERGDLQECVRAQVNTVPRGAGESRREQVRAECAPKCAPIRLRPLPPCRPGTPAYCGPTSEARCDREPRLRRRSGTPARRAGWGPGGDRLSITEGNPIPRSMFPISSLPNRRLAAVRHRPRGIRSDHPVRARGDDTVGGVGYIPATHPRNKRSATSLDVAMVWCRGSRALAMSHLRGARA